MKASHLNHHCQEVDLHFMHEGTEFTDRQWEVAFEQYTALCDDEHCKRYIGVRAAQYRERAKRLGPAFDKYMEGSN